jgi:chromosome segregation ATPase
MSAANQESTKTVRRPNEVCQSLDIQPYVLKFWEAEFSELGRRVGPKRLYGTLEFELAVTIKRLLQEESLTIAEAREALAATLTDVETIEHPPRTTHLTELPAELPDSDGGWQARLREIEQERDAAEGREARLARELLELKGALAGLRQQLDEAAAREQAIRVERTEIEKLFEEAQTALENSQQECKSLTAKLGDEHAAHGSTRSQLGAARQQLEAMQRESAQLSQRLSEREQQLTQTGSRLEQLQAIENRLRESERSLQTELSKGTELQAQLRAAQEKLKSERDQTGKLRTSMLGELRSLAGEIQSLGADLRSSLGALDGAGSSRER